jgi:hypothetical protein
MPARLLRFRAHDWAGEDDPIGEFCDPAWFRAFRRYLDARRRWTVANSGLAREQAAVRAD